MVERQSDLLRKFKEMKEEQLNAIANLNFEESLPLEPSNIEITNKINHYIELLNFQDDLNSNFEGLLKDFFHFFEEQFIHIFHFKDLSGIKELLDSLEKLLNELTQNQFDQEKVKEILNKMSNFFKILEECNLDSNNNNQQIDKLKYFCARVKNFVLQKHSNEDLNNLFKKEEVCFHKETNNFSFFKETKPKKSEFRRKRLLETAFIKKSKSQFGEDDTIIENKNNDEGIKTNELLISHNKKKGKKLFLRNFLQVYLVKENGIFCESYFSKYDHVVLFSYRKLRFYEVKVCFSNNETFENIQKYLFTIKDLFSKYIMIFNSSPKKNIAKVYISGFGKKQSFFKNKLMHLINHEIKDDCLIKISYFSNLFDAVSFSIKKFLNNPNFEITTNFSNELLKKTLNKINF